MSKDLVSNTVEKFIEVEKANNFFSINIKNHNFWEYLRVDICNKIIDQKNEFNKSKTIIEKKRKYYLYPLNIIYLLSNKLKLFLLKNNYDVILLNQDRSIINNGKKVNIHIYPIAKYLSKFFKVLIINQSNQSIPDKKIKSINEVPVNIFSLFFARFIIFNKIELKLLNRIKKTISKEFNLELDIISMAKRTYFYKIYYRKKLFIKLFNKFKNKIFFYYSDHSSEGIVEAAKVSSVKSIELQHSLISEFDIRYRIPFDITKTVPDYIFTYGDYWNNIYKLRSKTISIGFNYLNENYIKYFDSKDNQKNKIIIYSGILSNRNLQIILDELSIALPGKIIYFKLRQEEYFDWRNNYPEYLINRKNIIFIDNDDKPVHSYMSECSWQIGVDSTLIYEGLAFGLITFILKTGWFEQMKNLFNNDLAFLVTDSKEILRLINIGKIPSKKIQKNEIFKNNVELNLLNAVKKIIHV